MSYISQQNVWGKNVFEMWEQKAGLADRKYIFPQPKYSGKSQKRKKFYANQLFNAQSISNSLRLHWDVVAFNTPLVTYSTGKSKKKKTENNKQKKK